MIDMLLAIKTVMDVLMTTGVYPQSIITMDKDYKTVVKEEKRTEWQEGWNACQSEIFNKLNDALGKLEEGISDELALLMVADVGCMQDGKFLLNMNDTFHYACSDCEEVKLEEYKEVARLFRTYGGSGIDYWVAQKRGYDPEIPAYRGNVKEVRKYEEKRKK